MLRAWLRSFRNRTAPTFVDAATTDLVASPELFMELIRDAEGIRAYPPAIELMQVLNARNYVGPQHRLALEVATKQLNGPLTRFAIDAYRFTNGDVLYYDNGRWCYAPDESELGRKPAVAPLDELKLV
ncbi:MAG: hypothetical protein DI585_00565 [Pseudomonas fluorescens]|nr:MAG: hypothetical protein DI585_00565 [Pseudomonas fluorescens]